MHIFIVPVIFLAFSLSYYILLRSFLSLYHWPGTIHAYFYNTSYTLNNRGSDIEIVADTQVVTGWLLNMKRPFLNDYFHIIHNMRRKLDVVLTTSRYVLWVNEENKLLKLIFFSKGRTEKVNLWSWLYLFLLGQSWFLYSLSLFVVWHSVALMC